MIPDDFDTEVTPLVLENTYETHYSHKYFALSVAIRKQAYMDNICKVLDSLENIVERWKIITKNGRLMKRLRRGK